MAVENQLIGDAAIVVVKRSLEFMQNSLGIAVRRGQLENSPAGELTTHRLAGSEHISFFVDDYAGERHQSVTPSLKVVQDPLLPESRLLPNQLEHDPQVLVAAKQGCAVQVASVVEGQGSKRCGALSTSKVVEYRLFPACRFGTQLVSDAQLCRSSSRSCAEEVARAI